ncbi:hypothetical protein ABPG75_004611 [Micractinium tetrahymenae]
MRVQARPVWRWVHGMCARWWRQARLHPVCKHHWLRIEACERAVRAHLPLQHPLRLYLRAVQGVQAEHCLLGDQQRQLRALHRRPLWQPREPLRPHKVPAVPQRLRAQVGTGQVGAGAGRLRALHGAPLLRLQHQSTACLGCAEGYTIKGGKCVACPQHCLSCDSKGPSTCDPYTPNDSLPKLGCEPGYGLGSKGGCVPCTDKHCTACQNNAGVCATCDNGFASIGGKCLACKKAHCSTCDGTLTTCLGCAPGWGRDVAGGCGVNCTKSTGDPLCQACSTSPTICDACQDGYSKRLDAKGQLRCQPCKVANCKSCFIAPSICSVCADGHSLRPNGTCA